MPARPVLPPRGAIFKLPSSVNNPVVQCRSMHTRSALARSLPSPTEAELELQPEPESAGPSPDAGGDVNCTPPDAAVISPSGADAVVISTPPDATMIRTSPGAAAVLTTPKAGSTNEAIVVSSIGGNSSKRKRTERSGVPVIRPFTQVIIADFGT